MSNPWPNPSRKRKLKLEIELFTLNRKIRRLERKILLRRRRRNRVVIFSSSASSSLERSGYVSTETASPLAASSSVNSITPPPMPPPGTPPQPPPPQPPSAPPPPLPPPPSQPLPTLPAPSSAHATLQIEATAPRAGPSATPPPPDEVPEVNKSNVETNDEELETPLGTNMQKDIASRFETIATNGLCKQTLKALLSRYLIPGNCTKIDAPMLNLEVKSAITEMVLKRVNMVESKQKQTAAAIAALGEAITYLKYQKNIDTDVMLKYLLDAACIVCDVQYKDSLTRRNFILGTLKTEMKKQITHTKIDKFLFGQNLSEILETAKVIQKSAVDLDKPAPAKEATLSPSTSNISSNKRTPSPLRSQGTQPPAATTQRPGSPKTSRLMKLRR